MNNIRIGETITFEREVRPFSDEWQDKFPPLETVEGIVIGIEIAQKWLVTMSARIWQYHIYIQKESRIYKLEEVTIRG
jgi:hypothetical protein